MMLFWIITAAMILVALMIVAPALLRKGQLDVVDRDQQNIVIAKERLSELQGERDAGSLTDSEFEQAKLELEQTLVLDLDEGADIKSEANGQRAGLWTLVCSTLLIGLLTVGIYLQIGTPQMLDPAPSASAQVAADGKKMPSVEEMVTALTTRLEQAPDDSQGWYLLGRTYMVMNEFDKAVGSFERLYQLVDDQPSVMLALADATSMSNGGNLTGRPTELIRKAIVLAPDDPTALWLAGMAEDQAGEHQLAIDHWSKLQGLLPDDPDSLQRVTDLIKAARAKLGDASASAPKLTPNAISKPGIRLLVSVAQPLISKVNPNATLFVYARAVSGPKIPLAAVRLKASDLPAEVVLDDSTAMDPSMKLSSRSEVLVGALLSSGGSVSAAVGDLRGEVSPVKVGAEQPVALVIDLLVE